MIPPELEPGGESLQSRILALLAEVAPDVDPTGVDPQADFRDQFDFDSMDVFSFAALIHETFGIDIPERDYRQLTGLAKCVAYVRGKLPDKPDKPPPSPAGQS